MASEIRALLSAAQSAEVRGDVPEAVRLLREAAAFYRDRQLITRAMQMLRHARRLEGHEDPGPPLDGFAPRTEVFDADDEAEGFDGPVGEVDLSTADDFGFGDELMGGERRALQVTEAVAPLTREPFERSVTLADPAINAWCSFCCRPTGEVGALAAGPAGAFVCGSCCDKATALLGGAPPAPARTAPKRLNSLRHFTPPQQQAHDAFARRGARLTLIVGPEGVGKSWLLGELGDDVARLDVTAPLTALDEERFSKSLEHRPGALAVRGSIPTPALSLDGAHGVEHVYDTESLVTAVQARVSTALLSRVDSVLPLPTVDSATLHALALHLLQERGVALPAAQLSQLVAVAERSARSLHELVALISRISPGQYGERSPAPRLR